MQSTSGSFRSRSDLEEINEPGCNHQPAHPEYCQRQVTFIAKDYRDRAFQKPVTLDGIEFLRRFTLHILPKRLIKIRRFGIYNHTTIRKLGLKFTSDEKPDIEKIIRQQKPTETNVERFERLTGINPCLCPVCKIGRMVTVRELPRIRSPTWTPLRKPLTTS